MTIVAFASNIVDIFEVNDLMSSKGWHLNALQRPNRYFYQTETLVHFSVQDHMLSLSQNYLPAKSGKSQNAS